MLGGVSQNLVNLSTRTLQGDTTLRVKDFGDVGEVEGLWEREREKGKGPLKNTARLWCDSTMSP